jgi:hypothetical protein
MDEVKTMEIPPAIGFALAAGWGDQLERLCEEDGELESCWATLFAEPDSLQHWAETLGPFSQVKGFKQSANGGKLHDPAAVHASLSEALSDFLAYLVEKMGSVEMNVMVALKEDGFWYAQIISVFDKFKLKSPGFGPLHLLEFFDYFMDASFTEVSLGRGKPRVVLTLPAEAPVVVNFWIVRENDICVTGEGE